jgi:hypothetical protein
MGLKLQTTLSDSIQKAIERKEIPAEEEGRIWAYARDMDTDHNGVILAEEWNSFKKKIRLSQKRKIFF